VCVCERECDVSVLQCCRALQYVAVCCSCSVGLPLRESLEWFETLVEKKPPPPGGGSLLGGFQTKNPEEEDPP